MLKLGDRVRCPDGTLANVTARVDADTVEVTPTGDRAPRNHLETDLTKIEPQVVKPSPVRAGARKR